MLTQRIVLDKMNENLKELTIFNQHLVDSLPSGLLAITRNGIVKTCNQAAVEMLSLKNNSSVINKNYSDIPEFVPFTDWIENALQYEQASSRNEVEITAKDGQTKIIGFSTKLIENIDGNFSGVVLIFRDITDIRKMEKESALKDRLATLGEMMAKIAHEIRNPLNPIKGFAQLIINELPIENEAVQHAKIIIEEVDRLQNIIDDFLSLARDKGSSYTEENINLVIDNILKLLSTEFQKRGCKLTTQFDNELPKVLIDKNKIKQALLNIIQNALQSIVANGTITIRTYLGEKDVNNNKVKTTEKVVWIEVYDNGTGIEPTVLEKIFDPFFTTKEKGSGLGLPVCMRILHDHGGSLEIESEVGSGTLCRIILPIPK